MLIGKDSIDCLYASDTRTNTLKEITGETASFLEYCLGGKQSCDDCICSKLFRDGIEVENTDLHAGTVIILREEENGNIR